MGFVRVRSVRAESAGGRRFGLAVLFAIFIWFTWRGIFFFFSGDDMMNMHAAWMLSPWRLGRSLIEIWLPVYRPLGAAVYRLFYAVFGFHPRPLYVFCWLLLAANIAFAWRLLRELLPSPYAALSALALILVHGNFQDLYLSAGTIYDRLWFLFTVLGLTAYIRMKTWRGQALVVLCCVFAMDSKESGVALPLLLACYELLFQPFRQRLRSLTPLYLILAAISLLFVFGRVRHTPELSGTAAYAPTVRMSLWLKNLSEYFSLLTYRHIPFTSLTTGLMVGALAMLALVLRNRVMLFGWLFFIIAITPVALISIRPGYVLYVPDLGLGLLFAALLWQWIPRRHPAASFALITALMLWLHLRNWPPPYNPEYSPEFRLTEQFRAEYPTMPHGAKLLFVSDAFPHSAYDLLFNLRLMYHDHDIQADRVVGPPDQQPKPWPGGYTHAFLHDGDRYVELDTRNLAESQKLRILKGYTVGREMDFENRDYAAYLVSGIQGGDPANSSRWTSPEAKLKFDVYPAPAVLSMKFWVPDFVAKAATRTLHVKVDGIAVADYPLNKDGMNEPEFSVPASAISAEGFTVVELNVENPWKDTDGTPLGVVLMRAGFRYRR